MPELLLEREKRAKLVTGADNKSPEDKMKVMIAVNPSTFARRASYSSENAFNWIINIVNSTNKNTHFKLLIIHVKPPRSPIDGIVSLFSSCTRTSTPSADYMEAARTQVFGPRDELSEFEDTFTKKSHDHRIAYEWVRKTGRSPAKVICDEVNNLQPDVLVLGNRGLTYFQRLFRPNVSEYCAKHAECDVIRVKHNPEVPSPYDD